MQLLIFVCFLNRESCVKTLYAFTDSLNIIPRLGYIVKRFFSKKQNFFSFFNFFYFLQKVPFLYLSYAHTYA